MPNTDHSTTTIPTLWTLDTTLSVTNATEVFSGNNVAAILEAVEEEVISIVPDLSTAKGRKAVASLAHKVRRSKTALDKLRKAQVAVWKEQAKRVDEQGKVLRDGLDKISEAVRLPLTEWEENQAAEEAFLSLWDEAIADNAAHDKALELSVREQELAARELALAERERAAEAEVSPPWEPIDSTCTEEVNATITQFPDMFTAEEVAQAAAIVEEPEAPVFTPVVTPSVDLARQEAVSKLIHLGVAEGMALWFVDAVAGGAIPYIYASFEE